jgi:hypothetical protein
MKSRPFSSRRPRESGDPGSAAIAAVISYPALAQSPEKFERVVPAKSQPAVPRPAPAKPAVKPAEPAPPAVVPLDQQPLVAELMRKAESGEQENGICDRGGWPVISSYAAFYVK